MLTQNNCLVTVSCRTASLRLPAKALLPIADQPSILFLLRRLKKLTNLVLATTDLRSDDLLAKIVSSEGFNVRRGHSKNVFERLRVIANEHNLPYLVRITADCPLVDGEFVLDALDIANGYLLGGNDWDLASTKGFTPPGIDLEIIKVEAMNKISSLLDSDEREHVTLGLMRRKDEYVVRVIEIPGYAGKKGTYLLDTLDDYLRLTELINIGDCFSSPIEIINKFQ
jgi:spore coat polysaccharide biosynthesis protein SpsF